MSTEIDHMSWIKRALVSFLNNITLNINNILGKKNNLQVKPNCKIANKCNCSNLKNFFLHCRNDAFLLIFAIFNNATLLN